MTICKHSVYRYGFALAVVALSFPLKVILTPLIGRGVPFLLFFATTTINAGYGGIGPGLFSFFSSLLINRDLLLHPADSFPAPGWFLLEAFLITFLSAAWGSTRRRTEKAREENRQLRTKMEQSVLEQTGLLESANKDLENKISDQTRREEELKTALSLVNAALESTTDGLLVVDRGGRLERLTENLSRCGRFPPPLSLPKMITNQSIMFSSN